MVVEYRILRRNESKGLSVVWTAVMKKASEVLLGGAGTATREVAS